MLLITSAGLPFTVTANGELTWNSLVPANAHSVDVGAFDAQSVQITDRHDGLHHSMHAVLFHPNYSYARCRTGGSMWIAGKGVGPAQRNINAIPRR
jgi:hypothetical protein